MTKRQQPSAYENFENSIASSDSLISMYKELRKFRGLGQRGRLTAQNEDLLWLPRSAVVSSLSALDEYIHDVLRIMTRSSLREGDPSQHLCDKMSEIIPIKNGSTFREALPLLTSPDFIETLSSKLSEKKFAYESYQSPDKVERAYSLIGHADIFQNVSSIWPGPKTSKKELKDTLERYAKRRNQIVHEGDRERDGGVRHITPDYARDVEKFIRGLTSRLDRIAFVASEGTRKILKDLTL